MARSERRDQQAIGKTKKVYSATLIVILLLNHNAYPACSPSFCLLSMLIRTVRLRGASVEISKLSNAT